MIAASAFMDSQPDQPDAPGTDVSEPGADGGGCRPVPAAVHGRGLKAASAKGPPYLVTFFVIFLFTQSIGGLIGIGLLRHA